MKHYIKIPKTEAAVEAAQAILKAKGATNSHTPEQLVDSVCYPDASIIYAFVRSDTLQAFFVDSNNAYHQPGPDDTLTDLTPLFKEQAVDESLTPVGQNDSFRVLVAKEATKVGCQSFRNSDILRIADLVRKASQ